MKTVCEVTCSCKHVFTVMRFKGKLCPFCKNPLERVATWRAVPAPE